MEDKLSALIETVRTYRMSAEEVTEQRVSFAYGNAPHDERSTKEQVRQAVLTAAVPAQTL